jgi:ribonucleoside-diphosphate reductase alpha chain
LILKLDSPVPPHERLELVAETLHGIGGRHQVGFGSEKVLSLPDALSRAIGVINGNCSERKSLTDLCPQCGGGRFASTEGCHTCLDCGHSLC